VGRRNIFTQKQFELLNKIDPSGRLAAGILGVSFVILAIVVFVLFPTYGNINSLIFAPIILLIFGSSCILWVIVKTVSLYKKEKRLQVALLSSHISEINSLTPTGFEEWVALVFRTKGYATILTPASCDYGIDVIISKNGHSIGIQVKKYTGNVGVKAVQEVLAGLNYYSLNEGWVITSSQGFTRQAITLAACNNIKLYAYNDLAILLSNLQQERNTKIVNSTAT
jgi:restriction system protein